MGPQRCLLSWMNGSVLYRDTIQELTFEAKIIQVDQAYIVGFSFKDGLDSSCPALERSSWKTAGQLSRLDIMDLQPGPFTPELSRQKTLFQSQVSSRR